MRYKNQRRAYLPVIGDEVVVIGKFTGKLLVEEVDADRQTAGLRYTSTNVLMRDVVWTDILPLKHLTGIAKIINEIEAGKS